MRKEFPRTLLVLMFLFGTFLAFSQNEKRKTVDNVPYVVLKEGAGLSPQLGQEVKCHYIVSDADGNVLWSTRSLKDPEFIVLGEQNGLMAKVRDNCFLTMTSGGKYRFDIPKSMLSDNPQAADLPGNHLSYEIELIDFGPPRPSGVKLFLEIKEQKGITAALNKLQELHASRSETYVLREADVNRLGYLLLQENHLEAAIAVFQINVERNPSSFNVYDSLGDAYLQKGDKVMARANFLKTLELNPSYEAAREKLRDL